VGDKFSHGAAKLAQIAPVQYAVFNEHQLSDELSKARMLSVPLLRAVWRGKLTI
jgi:hypothetical protein